MWVLRRDGFVAEIERDSVFTGLADDTREQNGGGLKGKICGVFVAITKVPEHRGARTERAVRMCGMNAEGRCAASNEFMDDETLALQTATELMHGAKGGVTAFTANVEAFIMDVTVVGMDATELETRSVLDDVREHRCLIPGHDASAGHAAVDLNEDAECDIMLLRSGGEKSDRLLSIGDTGELRFGKLDCEFSETMRIDADAGHGE